MYLQNKYTNVYFNIVNKANATNHSPELYTENHHIIPKSLGGSNNKANRVKLTAREHFICHWLLTKMTDGTHRHKMIYALNGMKRKNKNQHRYETLITSRVYAKLKEQFAVLSSNRTVSIETKQKISASKKGKPGPKHSSETKQKIANSKLGKKRKEFSIEWKQNIGLSQIGKIGPMLGKTHSTETKSKMALAHKDKGPMSLESKQKLSDSKRGKKLYVDPITGRRYMK